MSRVRAQLGETELTRTIELIEALDNYAGLLGWSMEIASYGGGDKRRYRAELSMKGDPSALADFPETGWARGAWVMHVQPDDQNRQQWVVLRYSADNLLDALTGLTCAYITARPDSELAETATELEVVPCVG
ncbi:hypothetical protein HH308_06200 [Gordonia sp. TBRC 11910]|uniref:Uncharacterized protein n=1 Tax=Gordonia asplenii TaxID=2725283 RepID=A0A848KWG8_9ACTN|nr:hypothetical protein [Gordonia asplenii]NMO00803.1 hypothetical protein [Gordonia asplenii]